MVSGAGIPWTDPLAHSLSTVHLSVCSVSFEEVAIVPAGWTNVGPEGASFGSGSLPGYCSYTAKGVSTEAAVIASSGIHCFKNINDGVSGNANSWIPGYTASPYFAGISFDSPRSVNGFAVARDSLGQYRDRTAGTKTLQYTTVDAPDQNTPASDWKTAGLSFKVPDASRHIYSFSEPISATGFRIVTNDPNDCIDELELFQGTVDVFVLLFQKVILCLYIFYLTVNYFPRPKYVCSESNEH